MMVKGKVWKLGNHVNTDDIIAARYLNTTDSQELATHCLETLRPELVQKMEPGDILVAGENFGCGSSREHAPIAIKAAGFSLVIAVSFARIFLRNAINIGLPVVETSEAKRIREGDLLEVDFEAGMIKNLTQNSQYFWSGYPPFLQELIKCGGLMKWVRKKYIKSE
ncbi:MAG: 3-isopropylmalate dehydratase small subunit [Candidatus Omnitrophica bacterium]|nr:3-isopropylmalate dehydratase small subunit [Candidatus Omnitrophota bacterium]